MDARPLSAEGGSFAGSTHLVVEGQPRYQRTTAQAELRFYGGVGGKVLIKVRFRASLRRLLKIGV